MTLDVDHADLALLADGLQQLSDGMREIIDRFPDTAAARSLRSEADSRMDHAERLLQRLNEARRG